MAYSKNETDNDPVSVLFNAASKKELVELLKKLTKDDLAIRRICIDTLKESVDLEPSEDIPDESSAVMRVWYEIEPEISELDEYGCGDYEMIENVEQHLYELQQELEDVTLSDEDRNDLLDDVITYIMGGNSGIDDSLYNIAYAASQNEEQLRDLAKRFEELKQDWPINHARRIYRSIGDNKKYLELRLQKMKYGPDYYDLVTFYWETGEKQKAKETAEEGMKLAEGNMDELRMFLAERAKEVGDRETYLEYIFAQKTARLTLSSYKEFEEECGDEEWERYEERIIDLLEKNFDLRSAKIYMYRKEYEKALRYFTKSFKIPFYYSESSEDFTLARELEEMYPEQILEFYKSTVGNLNISETRKIYAKKAWKFSHIRRVLVEVMNKNEEWIKLAKRIKLNNIHRPAFQKEFSEIIPDWKSL